MTSINELAEEMQADGKKITPRTIKYYVEQRLLPEPIKQGGYKEGVRLVFPNKNEVITSLKKIFELKGKGYKLSEIRKAIKEIKAKSYGSERKKYLKKFIERDGQFRIILNKAPEAGYITAQNIQELMNKVLKEHKDKIPTETGRGLNLIDYGEVERRALFKPLRQYKDYLVFDDSDIHKLTSWAVLHREHELSWDILEKLFKTNLNNLKRDLPYPEPDGVRFTVEWIGWQFQKENNLISSLLVDYLSDIRKDRFFKGPTIWDSKYDNVDDFISDFLNGKCAFTPMREDNGRLFFLRRV